MKTNYCVIPLDAETLLAQYVQMFEAQNPAMKAIVVGVYVPSEATEANSNMRMLGRIQERIDVFGSIKKLHAFLLTADDNQLSTEIRDMMLVNGVKIMTREEYSEYYQSLQNE